MLGLISRTACIDFASPGVEQRLHQLLFDLIANVAGAALTTQPGHPLQSHLRVACTCLTIFQGQRANGEVFAQDQKYQVGLEAAWSEAMLLDQTALDEPKSAEASLWAVFMIMVTTGATATFFHKQLHGLLQDLQLRYWEQVRKVLLDFIYPVELPRRALQVTIRHTTDPIRCRFGRCGLIRQFWQARGRRVDGAASEVSTSTAHRRLEVAKTTQPKAVPACIA